VGGTKSFTTDKFSGRELIQLTVVPTSLYTNQYDITIVDSESDPIVAYTDVTGIFISNERIPLQGVYTLLISNASIDEPIRIIMRIGES